MQNYFVIFCIGGGVETRRETTEWLTGHHLSSSRFCPANRLLIFVSFLRVSTISAGLQPFSIRL